MPTTYTHWRFGQKCIKQLPKEYQDIINNNINIFNYGVHGPDIYFYYNVLKHNNINDYGTLLHDLPAKDTLKIFKNNFSKTDNRDAALAYILGFLCHFTLDSYCHSFIDRAKEVKGISHAKIESQLDRYFLTKDNQNPNKYNIVESLKPDKQMSKIISSLYNKFDDATIYKTISDQKLYLSLLHDTNNLKRNILTKGMEILKCNDFIDLLLTDKNEESCFPLCLRCDKYFEIAILHYPKLVDNFMDFLLKNAPLDPYFDNNFSIKENYKEIPILDIDKEKEYIITNFQE